MQGNYLYPSKDPMVKFAREMRIRNFSGETIKSYIHYNKELLRFANKFSDEICRDDIKEYLDWLYGNGRSTSTVNLAINALKMYYGEIMKRKFFDSKFGIKRPKKEKVLPTVLSKDEIINMIMAIDNIKHKLVIQVLYSTGIRVSELRSLEISRIDFIRKIVTVKAGKGKKDRVTVIFQAVLDNIDKYLKEYRPLKYLFEGLAGKKMSARTFQKIVSQAALKAGIKKSVSAHTLRHSFATHQLENNVNLRYIQSMLGHARLETTQVYTRVAVNKFGEIGDLL